MAQGQWQDQIWNRAASLLCIFSFVAIHFLTRHQGFWRAKANCGVISGQLNELI